MKLSIKYKLFLLISIPPIVTLLVYGYIVIDIFNKDRTAYVYDSTTNAAKSLSVQLGAEIELAEGRRRSNVFTPDQKIVATFVNHQKIKFFGPPEMESKEKFGATLLKKACPKNISLAIEKEYLWIAFCDDQKEASSNYGTVMVLYSPSLTRTFLRAGIYSNFLIDTSGEIILSPENSHFLSFKGWSMLQDIQSDQQFLLTQESKLPDGHEVIATLSKVPGYSLSLCTLVEKSATFRAIKILISKSFLVFLIVISLAIVLSIVSSHQLTFWLRTLSIAAGKVANGDFTIRVAVPTQDEVGLLGNAFDKMTVEVGRLMKDNVSKARMEKELETAKTVQETLFPVPQYKNGKIEISGFYEPASECGGDWWFYTQLEKKTLIWIGDVTGHGAPSALMTSAARSAASLIEAQALESPKEIMQLLNRAIFDTSKGKLNMTFFFMLIDEEKGEIRYSNASHNPPLLMRHKDGDFSKNDLVLLDKNNHPRLGEKKDVIYSENTEKIESGDCIFLYTDGLLDIETPEGKVWGERNLYKTLVSAKNTEKTAEGMLNLLTRTVSEFRKDTSLVDDVTAVFTTFGDA